jgi:hypothetical protein
VTRLLIGTAVMIAALALIMVTIRLIGGRAAPPAAVAILDPGACPQPCWHGIRPGETTFRQAQVLLEANHDQIVLPANAVVRNLMSFTQSAGWSGWIERWPGESQPLSNIDAPIQYIRLQPPPNTLQLGDALLLFGEPLASDLCPSWPVYPPRVGFRTYMGSVFFQSNIDVTVVSGESRFDPHTPVTSITYFYPADEPPYRFDMPPWRGFARVDDREFCSK